MPTISMFYGIVIDLYSFDDERRNWKLVVNGQPPFPIDPLRQEMTSCKQ